MSLRDQSQRRGKEKRLEILVRRGEGTLLRLVLSHTAALRNRGSARIPLPIGGHCHAFSRSQHRSLGQSSFPASLSSRLRSPAYHPVWFGAPAPDDMEEQSFTLSNRLDQVESVQDEIKYVLQTRGVRLKQIHAILLALGEWLEHVILNAYADDAEHRIEVDMSVGEDEVRLCIQDDGRDLNVSEAWAANQPTSPPSKAAGGQGLHLIRTLMDHVEHQRHNGKNRVLMTKEIIPLS